RGRTSAPPLKGNVHNKEEGADRTVITFAEIRDGEEFVSGNGVYMKVPEMKTSIRKCEACGIGINAVIIGREDGAPLADSSGRPMLPWGVHFCPGQRVRGFSLSMWEVNAHRWLEKAQEALRHH